MIPLLSFLAPSRLWLLLLIPALVVLYLWLVQRKRSRSKQLGRTMFDLVIPRDRTWLRHLAVGLSILSLLTLTVAFAKPKDQVSVPRERATIVVTIDISLSMEARGRRAQPAGRGQGRRRAVRQHPAAEVQRRAGHLRRHRDHLVPPTLDRGAVTAAIEALRPQASTAIGEGIYTSLAALAQVPPDPDNPTDGRSGADRAAQRRQDPGRPPVGPGGAGRQGPDRCRSTPSRTAPPDGYIEIGGRQEPVPVDRAELARVSRISGGEAYTATSAGELKEVYKDIGSSVGKEKVDREVTSRYAGFGLGFAILAALGNDLARRPLAVEADHRPGLGLGPEACRAWVRPRALGMISRAAAVWADHEPIAERSRSPGCHADSSGG